ncbi:MAG: FHA domain-containing protein, partial [Deltaproteobacteria bacterium]
AAAAPSAPAPMAGAAPAPVRCTSCGFDVPAGFRFCGQCGTPVAAPVQPRVTADVAPQPQAQPRPHGQLVLIRPDGSEGGAHPLREGENLIGRDHGDLFANDGYLSPTHAELILNAAGAVIRDLDSLNGVFIRMTEEEEIEPGQILRIGQELLRFDLIEPPAPTEDGTEVMGSPNPGYWGKLSVIIGEGVDGAAFPLLGDSVTLGRERGDINFSEDGYVSGLHARISTRDGKVFVADLGSSNGTFLKVNGEREVKDGTFILLGQQLFRIALRS